MESTPVKLEQEWLWQKCLQQEKRTFNKKVKYQLESAYDEDINVERASVWIRNMDNEERRHQKIGSM